MTSADGQQQQQQMQMVETRVGLESTSDISLLSTLPTISVAVGVNDMSLKQLLQPSSTSATAANGQDLL